MRYMLRWWETLGRPERIVAMSLAVGGTVAITNSTVWAIAVSYMTYQKAKVALAAAQRSADVAATSARNVAPSNMADKLSPENGVIHARS